MGGGTKLIRTLLAGEDVCAVAGAGVGDSDEIEVEGDVSCIAEEVGAGDSCASLGQIDARAIKIAKLARFVMSTEVETSLAVGKSVRECREIPRLRSE
jgi:hypothetical protein